MSVTMSTEMFTYNLDTGEIDHETARAWVGEDGNREEFVLYQPNPNDSTVWTLLVLSYRTYLLSNPAASYIDGSLAYVGKRLQRAQFLARQAGLPTRFELKAPISVGW